MFKPHKVEFYWIKAKRDDEIKRKECYAQLSLFNRQKDKIEHIPFDFRYKFFCQGEPSCSGHDLSIVDWEIGQSYRDWQKQYKTKELLLDKIKERWLDRICSDKNDIYFFVGNLKRFRDIFMILGVFYPPIEV